MRSLSLFLSLVPQGSPSVVSQELLDPLLWQRPDWGSQQQFKATPGTLQSYRTGYLSFCCRFSVCSPFPASESLLSLFVSYLASWDLSYSSIHVYLSGIRFA